MRAVTAPTPLISHCKLAIFSIRHTYIYMHIKMIKLANFIKWKTIYIFVFVVRSSIYIYANIAPRSWASVVLDMHFGCFRPAMHASLAGDSGLSSPATLDMEKQHLQQQLPPQNPQIMSSKRGWNNMFCCFSFRSRYWTCWNRSNFPLIIPSGWLAKWLSQNSCQITSLISNLASYPHRSWTWSSFQSLCITTSKKEKKIITCS